MAQISISIADQPSRSKGWARYKVSYADNTPVLTSSTGNEWVGAGHSAEVPDGTVILVTIQVCLNVGKARTARKETSTETFRLVAGSGEAELVFRPGSQGMTLRVTGAAEAS